MIKKVFGILSTIVLLAFVFTTESLATEKVNPNNGLNYKTKRLQEKIVLLLKFSNSGKVNFQKELLSRRLEELKYIINTQDITFLETTSQRYETTAGILAEYVLAKKLSKERDSIIKMFEEHQKEILTLRDNYDYGISEWRLVMNDYNSLGLYIEKLRQM